MKKKRKPSKAKVRITPMIDADIHRRLKELAGDGDYQMLLNAFLRVVLKL